MAFAFHVVMIVLDSCSWHLVPMLKWYVIKWLQWQEHVLGSWRVAVLPGNSKKPSTPFCRRSSCRPPSAALAVGAKAFRR